MENLKKETIATLEKLVQQLNKDDNTPLQWVNFVEAIKCLSRLLEVIDRP